jgi:hypothetical protein
MTGLTKRPKLHRRITEAMPKAALAAVVKSADGGTGIALVEICGVP